MAVAAILFDLDNTLVDDAGSARRAIAATCAEVAQIVSGLPQHELGEAYDRISTEVWTGVDLSQRNGEMPEVTGASFRRECWRKALESVRVMEGAALETAVERYAFWREQHLELYPETEEVLAALEGRVKLAIVTNGTADTHRRKLELLGFDRRFDYCAVAGELGLMKPDLRLFLHTSEKLGVAPEECIVVGDSLESDVGGAKAAGMGAVWLNRECRPLMAGMPRPHLVVPDLRELLVALGLPGGS